MGRWLKTWVSLGLSMVVLTSLKQDMTAQAVDIDSSDGQTKGIDIVPQTEEDFELFENYLPYLSHPTSHHSLARLFRWFRRPHRNYRRKPFTYKTPKNKGRRMRLWGPDYENTAFPENVEFVINEVFGVCQPQDTSLQQSCIWQTESVVKNCSASLSKQEPFRYTLKCSNEPSENLQGGADEVTDTVGTNKEEPIEEGSNPEGNLMDYYHINARCLGCIFGMI